jgi:hypothetical protein
MLGGAPPSEGDVRSYTRTCHRECWRGTGAPPSRFAARVATALRSGDIRSPVLVCSLPADRIMQVLAAQRSEHHDCNGPRQGSQPLAGDRAERHPRSKMPITTFPNPQGSQQPGAATLPGSMLALSHCPVVSSLIAPQPPANGWHPCGMVESTSTCIILAEGREPEVEVEAAEKSRE